MNDIRDASLAETTMTAAECKPIAWEEAVETALAALDAGWATLDELIAALADRRRARPEIGKLALSARKLTMKQVFQILEQQAIDGKLFGEIAVDKGFLTEIDVEQLLAAQATLCPTLSEILVANKTISSEQASTLRNRLRERLRQF